MHEQHNDKDWGDEIRVEQLKKGSECISFTILLLRKLACCVFRGGARHHKEVEREVDALLHDQEGEQGCCHAVHTVGELYGDVRFVAAEGKHLVELSDEVCMMLLDVQAKELFDSSFGVD